MVCRVQCSYSWAEVALVSGWISQFNHTIRPYNHNRQRHSLWGSVTWPCLLNFSGLIILKKSLENSDVLCRKSYWPGGTGHSPLFSIHICLLLGAKFGHWGHFDSLRGSCHPNLQYQVLANFYWTLLSSLPARLAFIELRYATSLMHKFCW